MKKIILVAALSVFSLAPLTANAQDFSADFHGALNLSTFTGTNIASGLGSNFGIHSAYFFHKSLGLFTGLDLVTRPVSMDGNPSMKSLEIPFGLMFRGSPSDLNLVGIGITVDLPVSDSLEPNSLEPQGGMSLIVVTNRYYEINSNLSLGLYSDLRYSLHPIFKDPVYSSTRTFSFDIGLGARVNL